MRTPDNCAKGGWPRSTIRRTRPAIYQGSPLQPMPELVPTMAGLIDDPDTGLWAWVPSSPVAQPRHRSAVVGKRNPKLLIWEADRGHRIHGWKARVAFAMNAAKTREPLTGPVCVWLDFRFDTPKSLVRRAKTDPVVEKTWVDSKPDLDNLRKPS